LLFRAKAAALPDSCPGLKRKILILDEPTSFVDIETDKAVHKCIQEEFKEATIFTIAHRISTIANNEKIIVIEEGSIV
jgi:ATP-binding cassette subfamily C (CFTR/MRP) protein 1